ncbi:hemolysin XhlA family protein [Cyanothece sp. BG0011]|uniref:hemolysin XhlA family protein n=1 Tax=Cyanothece sp. BG0011 TaxID=2082950 RepID=UPI000D1F368A|nr:hemolysin XhlA family protein [Cyanothece sp. BG0011]
MNEPTSVSYPIAEILKELKQDIKEVNQKLDKVNTKLNTIEVELAEVKTEVKGIKDDVNELKGSTKAQIWTLIGILVTAVSGFLIAVARFVFSPVA